jgi:flagellar motor switch protein FliN/FliY
MEAAMSGDGGGMGPEDFGLGSDFDEALAEATDGGGAKKDDAPAGGGGAMGDEPKLPRMDFSKLKMILDIPLKVSVELGRTKMLVNDLLQLGQGSVIELDKIAGEPMEILINDKLVALGEVVVVNEKFGVRLTDVISQFGLGDLTHSDKAAG